MSRRKQACPIKSSKARDEPPSAAEGEPAIQDTEDSAEQVLDTDCDIPPSDTQSHEEDVDSPGLPPLVINTDNPSSPPPSSALDDIAPLTGEDADPDAANSENQTFPSTSPGLDIPPAVSNVCHNAVPLSLTSPSASQSPDHPSTPSSLNSSSSLLESTANKQRRGKRIMPVAGDDGKSRWQCPKCSELLGSDHDFTVHIRSHNTAQSKEPNSCTICGKVLSSQSSLDRHMLVHSGERPFKCKVCKMSFTTNGNMHRHSRIHSKEEQKAASAAEAAERDAKPTKSSSKLPSSKKVHGGSAAAVADSPSPSAPVSAMTSSAMQWHPTGVFAPTRAAVPPPMSGVDLQKLMTANSLLRPVQPTFSPFPPAVHSAYVSPLQINFMSQFIQNQKRLMSFPDENPSPPKKLRGENESGGVEAKDGLNLQSPCAGDRDSEKPGAGEEGGDDEEDMPLQLKKMPASKKLHQKLTSSDKSDQHQHQHTAQDECKHCHKTFISDYGLEYHLSQHHKDLGTADSLTNGDADGESAADAGQVSRPASFKCCKCDEAFASQHKLVFHNLLVHLTNQQAEEAVAEALAGSKNGISKVVMDASMPGFSDLDFMDFTTDKFSLVAKAWCEQMPRRSTSKFHEFTCEECSCSFPSRSSLVLHRASHKPQNWTKCGLCDCYFVSTDLLHVHMFKHAADNSFMESLQTEEGKDSGQPESMEKNDFLAMFDLVPKDELSGSTANEDVIETISKEQNNKYYARLSQAFAKKKANSDLALQSEQDSGIANESPNPSTLAHQSKDQNPSKSILPFPSMSTPPGLPSAAHQSLFSSYGLPKDLFTQNLSGSPARFGSPLGAAPSPLGLDVEATQDQKKGIYNCQFCGESFLNSRTLKGHVRVHLGLSPYKCQFCSYSSADKSTLIRHMRTHNGQRPFICTLCKYAFTTKANCERHIRKKHGVIEKEEIERSVTFKNCPTDPTEGIECFQSPDTVCQYCGEDFKFFRALKNHLKTHSSCRQKPFTCTRCLVGFSMKANAIRHVQKQHLDVPHKDIENFILVNEPAAHTDMDDDSDNMAADYETGSPSPSSTPGVSGQDSSPPQAHSTPVLSSNSKTGGDLPLDFSLRNPELAARLMGSLVPQSMRGAGDTGEQPIDLTTKPKSSGASSVASTSPSPAAPPTPKQAPSPIKTQGSSEIPCKLCTKVLSSKEAAQQHLIEVHQVPPAVFATFPTSDNNNNTSTSPAQMPAFMPMLSPLQFTSQLTSLMQARAAAPGVAPIFPAHPAFSHVQQKLQAYLQAAPRSLLAGVAASIKKEPGTASSATSTGSESSCDLASVNKIIESTATQNIEMFLKPQTTTSGSDDSEPQTTPWESADEDSDQSLEQMYKQSLNGKILVKPEGEMEEVADEDGDEDMEDEMNAEEEEDSIGDMARADAEGQFLKSDLQSESGILNAGSKAGMDQANASDSGTAPVKKKRNSYADSPHKLNCPHCPRSFPWVSSLNRHMLTHTGQKPFKCPRCPVTFSTKSNRERHLIRKHGVNMLDPASRQTMDRPYKCHLCVFSSFSTESNLLKHYKERHPGCNPPDRYLRRQDGDLEGLDMGQTMEEMDEMAMASLDNSNMDSWSESASIDAGDADTPTSTVCKTPVGNMVENVVAALLKKDNKPSPIPTTVQVTALNLTPNTTTINNNNNNNSIDDNDDDSMDLPLAFTSFSGSAERHINPEKDNYNVDKITYCWKCGEQFTSRKLLVRHLKEHNIDLPFKCYLCDASYDSRLECLVHQEKSHSSDWAILKDKNGVDSIEVYSERLDRIVERNCKTGQFLEEGEDGVGVAMETGEDGQAEMVASDYLQRKVYCSLCSKRFWSLQDLRRHMRSHTGERPFECDKCQKRFTLKHSMMRHRRKHTDDDNTDSPIVFSDDEDEAIESSGKAPALNMGSGHKALRQHLAAAVMRAANIPTTVTDGNSNSSLLVTKNKNKNNNNNNNNDNENNSGLEGDDGDDILHNLLGVESATIDQIIEAKGSAASLLGV